MQDSFWFMAGLATGAIVSALVARWTLRRIIRRIRAAERRARDAERMADLGSMTSGLAHEIKNPLSTIGLNAQLLAEGIDDAGLDEETRGRLSRRIASLRREIDRLRGILTDFLQFAGEVRLNRTPSDFNLAVDELADFFLPQAEHHQVRMRTELSPVPLWADMDVPLVKQAVLNLMLNAVQAMTEPGRSDLSVRELILRSAASHDNDGRPTVELHVIDTGPGIPPEVQARMFQPYFTTKSGGTGLGLATTRRLIEAHGGRLEFYTQPGKGTDFTIVLPSTPPPAPATAAGAVASISK
ncbi:MAG: hypothetical protein AMXMBFR58_13120 [Phycisphaerae bacterium]